MNHYVRLKTADLYRPNARFIPERQRYQVLTPFGKLGYSQEYRLCAPEERHSRTNAAKMVRRSKFRGLGDRRVYKGAIEPGKSEIPVQRFDNVPRLFFPFLWVFWKLFYAVLTTAHWILNRTCRIDIEGHPEGRHILCGWHESIIPYSVAYRRLPLRYLVIQNNAWFMPPIIWLVRSRGAQSSIDISYSSFGKSTISKVTSQLAVGESLLAFPDGPSGPAHVLDRSLLVVAERSGAPIIPLRVETSMALVISWAWDKKRIPLPFSRVRVRCGNPIVAVPGEREATERKLLAALGP